MKHYVRRSTGTGGMRRTLFDRHIPLLLLALSIVAPVAAHGQGGREKDQVLYPYQPPVPLYVGIEGGYGWWTNQGNFFVNDGERTCVAFNAGEGAGMTFGAKGMIYLTHWFFLSPRVRRENRSGHAMTPLPGEPVRDGANNVVELTQEGHADIRVSSVALDATIGVEFFGLYLFGGGSMSLLEDGTYDYSEQLTGPPGFAYSDTRTRSHTLISNRKFDRYENSVYDLRGGVGYVLEISRFVINPEVFYVRPLTSVLSAPEDLKQTGVVATIGIMYNIGEE